MDASRLKSTHCFLQSHAHFQSGVSPLVLNRTTLGALIHEASKSPHPVAALPSLPAPLPKMGSSNSNSTLVLVGMFISFTLLMIMSPREESGLMNSGLGHSLRQQTGTVGGLLYSLPRAEVSKRCEALKTNHGVASVLEPGIAEFEARRDWVRLGCTSYFWVKQGKAVSGGESSTVVPLKPRGPAMSTTMSASEQNPIKPKPRSPSSASITTTANVATVTANSHDPLFGKHWPSTPTPDIIHTLHGTFKAEGGGIPSSKTSVWDLVHEGHLEVSDGTCPSSALKCCPKKNPMKVRAKR